MSTRYFSLIVSVVFIMIMTACKPEKSEYEKIVQFAQNYTAAWNSKQPEKMASFYAEDGTLIVNNGKLAFGRKQIAETAQPYMDAFPDMELTMDSLTVGKNTYRYYWTFTGTNTGPDARETKLTLADLKNGQ